MTRQTFSTDKFIEELETWETKSPVQECFPEIDICHFESRDEEGSITTLLCSQCPLAANNRKHFINTLKTIKLLELDHVAIPETPEANEGGE